MIPPADRALRELGRTEGGPDTLALLARDQDTRRMLLLRAVLDTAERADVTVFSRAARTRLREAWALLEEADRVRPPDGGALPPASARGGTAARGGSLSPARARLLHPLAGPWIKRCLHGLDAEHGPRTQRQVRELSQDLAHFGALAAAAAARAGIPFALRLTVRDGLLTLPSLGALRTSASGAARVDVVHRRGSLTLRQPGAADVVVHLESGLGAWSGATAWTPAHALPGLVPGSAPVPLDDLDPYRTVCPSPRYQGLSGPVTLDDAGRKRWLHAWSGTAAQLRLGGEQRVTEAAFLLRCLVPLSTPAGAFAADAATSTCSGTRREAFGAVLSSTPPTPTVFAATLVHELQHAQIVALSDMVTLHHADCRARYFAPWRPDPRPYDGLLLGTHSHLALADFFQRHALADARPAHRDAAWSQHARYREQVGAALPTLVASDHLTVRGRQFVDEMIAVYERMAEQPAPRDLAARAQEYVRAARALWLRRHAARVRQSRD